MNYDEWVKEYKPIENPNGGGFFFETYGEDLEFVKKYDNSHIWTNIETEGYDTIDNGYWWCNRMGYYITEVAWETDGIQVILRNPNDLNDNCEKCGKLIDWFEWNRNNGFCDEHAPEEEE